MSASMDELVDRLSPSERFTMLTKLARKEMAAHREPGPIRLGLDDENRSILLLEFPGMPDLGPYSEADRAEDARRLATLDATVTVDELLEALDSHSDHEREGS